MERRSPASSDCPRPRRRASQHFNEVVSNGPTAIPPEDDVNAAISSVLAVDDPGIGQDLGLALQRQRQEAQRRTIRHTTENARVTATASAQGNGANDSTGRRDPSHPAVPMIPPHAVPTIPQDAGGGHGWGLLNLVLFPLWVTIDALKWAGGTVNEIALAPVMRLANPWGLAGSMLTAVKAFTPQRARDLARVVGNGMVNAAVLVRTSAGVALLSTGGRALRSLSVAVSSPAGRQLLVDSATGFVKFAEALDTPEAKLAVQQGAVVIARVMDTLASRHSKIFVKNVADVIVRFAEVANSREATVMAAEVTANLLHAMEMEYVAGVDRTGDGVPSADSDSISMSGDPSKTAQSDLGGNSVDGTIPPTHGDGSLDHPSHAAGEGLDPAERVESSEHPERSTKLGFASRPGRTRNQRSVGGGPEGATASIDEGRGGTTGFKGGVGDSEGGVEDSKQEEKTPGWDFDHRRRGTGVTAAELLRRGMRINPTPIRQEDLTGETPLRKLRDNPAPAPLDAAPGGKSKAVHRRTTGAARTSNIDAAPVAVRSAPSSPRDRKPSCSIAAAAALVAAEGEAAATEAAASAPVAASGRDMRGHRRRASSETDALLGSGQVGESDMSEVKAPLAEIDVPKSPGGSGGEDMVGEGISSLSGVEYVRHGRAFLPRFSGQRFASLLRGQPLGLEQQLEAPSDGSLEYALARAARIPLETLRTVFQPKIRTTGNDTAAAGDEGNVKNDAPADKKDAFDLRTAAIPLMTPGAKAARGWKQLVFALLLLLFAADGLWHRWNSLYWREGRKTRGRPSAPPPTRPFGASDGSGDLFLENRFRATFLPPSCEDHISGVTMAVWVTPSGPCLSPLGGDVGNTRNARESSVNGVGLAEPLCAASFPLCGTDEA